MPRIDLELLQGVGKPTFALAAAVTKANPGGYTTVSLRNGSAIPTTVFNVMNYGALGNGTHDDQPAILAAYNAAYANSVNGAHSTVFFPAGMTYYLTWASRWYLKTIRTNDWYGQTSPTHQCRGTICFSGYGATLKYENSSNKFTWLTASSTSALYSTYGNLVIEGFMFDCNWREPSSMAATIISLGGMSNKTNIQFRDITTTDHIKFMTAATDNDQNCGILINANHESRSQLHYSYCTDITVNGCTVYSQGKGIGIYSNNRGTDTTYGESKVIYDNINVDNCWVDNRHTYGSCIHLGSYGAGYRCSVKNSHWQDSTDNGLEIDAFNEALVENCTFNKVVSSIGLTRFSYPYKTTTPTYTMRNCHFSGACGNKGFNTTTGAPRALESPRMDVVVLSGTALDSRRSGNYIYDGCTGTYGGYSTYNHYITCDSNMDSVTINNCDVTDTSGLASHDVLEVVQRPAAGITLPISIHDVRWRNSTGNSYALLTASQVLLTGSRSVDSDISGLT
jgi:hypothetical protein